MKAWILTWLMALVLAAPLAVAEGEEEDEETFPGLPDQARFGICTAYDANEKGRENGNAGSAAPFAWLADEAEAADQTVEEYCSEVGHPGDENADSGQGGGRPSQ